MILKTFDLKKITESSIFFLLYGKNEGLKSNCVNELLENFNGIFYLVIFLIILAMNAFYAYNCLFNTKNFIGKYGVDVTAAFFARFLFFLEP